MNNYFCCTSSLKLRTLSSSNIALVLNHNSLVSINRGMVIQYGLFLAKKIIRNWRLIIKFTKISIYYTVFYGSKGANKTKAQCCISSLAFKTFQSHYQLKNMHWILDINFRDNESRIHMKQGILVFNVIRKIVIALLKLNTTILCSMTRK